MSFGAHMKNFTILNVLVNDLRGFWENEVESNYGNSVTVFLLGMLTLTLNVQPGAA